ncbi:uncharacterized protein MONBRDRAFT_24850 [Monosiga brevicollis MX1]|uniref:Uncharacterized protein n=1 Tax=Monosiga brevicollis TaxID=81824 RepID=A9UXX8_MONBE|nr:uncharacterized protein MONBRDRAFT_24850 [Monosiga brevicollis MX1]EDQ89763.1 predicted protein [Monosiga brevicollis MX1]|eukprot:XP_001745185.1 hypothetical protein [Monosiga brevicollis MX1]
MSRGSAPLRNSDERTKPWLSLNTTKNKPVATDASVPSCVCKLNKPERSAMPQLEETSHERVSSLVNRYQVYTRAADVIESRPHPLRMDAEESLTAFNERMEEHVARLQAQLVALDRRIADGRAEVADLHTHQQTRQFELRNQIFELRRQLAAETERLALHRTATLEKYEQERADMLHEHDAAKINVNSTATNAVLEALPPYLRKRHIENMSMQAEWLKRHTFCLRSNGQRLLAERRRETRQQFLNESKRQPMSSSGHERGRTQHRSAALATALQQVQDNANVQRGQDLVALVDATLAQLDLSDGGEAGPSARDNQMANRSDQPGSGTRLPPLWEPMTYRATRGVQDVFHEQMTLEASQ